MKPKRAINVQWIFVVCIFHFVINAHNVRASMVYRPENQAAPLGGSVTFECSSSSSSATLYWVEHPKEDSGNFIAKENHLICGPRTNQYSVATMDPYTLTVNLSTLNMGMTYSCMEETESTTNYAYVEATVISGPSIRTNYSTTKPVIEGMTVKLVCSIQFGGRLRPDLDWSIDTNSSHRLATPTVAHTDTSVISTLIVITRFDLHGSTFCCAAQYGQQLKIAHQRHPDDLRMPGDIADNNPELKKDLETHSPALNVFYGPKELKVMPSRDSYRPGDIVTLAANANPEAKYRWKDSATEEIYSEQASVVITIAMSENIDGSAYNTFSGKTMKSKVSINVVGGKRTSRATWFGVNRTIFNTWLAYTLLCMF